MSELKSLEQIEAKLALLNYLRSERGVNAEIVAAAKQKIGADLADALSGDLGKALKHEFLGDLQRLRGGQLRQGDQVRWMLGKTEKVSTVLGVDDRVVKVDFNGERAINRSEAAPATLDDLQTLYDACLAATDG